jgi:ribosomal protein L12E/L44/L45/RPP1/RPP2
MNTKVGITLTASDQTQAAFNSVNAGLGALKNRTDSLFSTFSGGVASGLMTGLLGAGFGAALKSAIDGLDKLDEAAERIGVSVEELSVLNFAGKMNGLELDDITAGISKLSVKMQEAASGSKEAAALFSDVGVKVTDANGKLKPAEQVLADIAERFAGFEDGAAKTALAVDLFGKSGAKLVPLLNGGADGLARMRKEAESLGLVIDSKLAKQAAEFNDNMDKLSMLSGTVAKSIAAELLPSLNQLASEFLAAKSAGMGFWEAVVGLGTANPGKSAGQQVRELSAELDKLNKTRDAAMAQNRQDGGSIDTGDLEAKIGRASRQLEYFKKLQIMQALEGADGNYGNEGRSRTGATGKDAITRTDTSEKAKKAKAETAQASAEATAYAKSMETLANMARDADAAQLDLTKSQKALFDLMTSAEWASMPDAWKQTAVAQFETAYAAEQAADATKRLNDMLGDTESAGIEKARSDMLLLLDALEKGLITEQKYLEAVDARLNGQKKQADAATGEMDEFAKSAARNMQTSLADFLFDPFAKGTEDMATQFGRMLQRMAAEAAAAAIMKNLFGSFGQSTSGGGSGDWGWVGQAASFIGAFFADGGIMTGNGPVPLRKYAGGGIANRPQLAMFGEGSQPEAYVPLPDGRRIPVSMQGGSGMTINQTIYAGKDTDAAQVRRSAAAGARNALGVMNGARRYG